MSQTHNIQIDKDRLWNSLMDMAQIGPGVAGGNNRQTLTDADGVGRALFQDWCLAAGLEMGLDQMGNMFATRRGTDPDALPVYLGSHLDTQPTGGKYDGVLGVLGGLEVIRTLNDLNIATKHPIVLVNWTNEEGTRFAPALLSSGVFSGKYDQDWAYERIDSTGARFGDELERIGWRGAETVGARKMHAYFELHIEQGPILEAEGMDVGVVTHGQGQRWIECTITGKAAHTGSTPMHMRQDAGRGLAQIIELVNTLALEHAPNAVGTIGHIEVSPNSRNVIAGQVVCTVDMRSHLQEALDAMYEGLLTQAPEICAALGLEFEYKIISQMNPPAFDETCVAAVRDAAETLGYKHRDIVSGAGHDACCINDVAPSAMIFCPCVDGLSHNEAEEITPEWAKAGTDVLLHAVLAKAEVVRSN
jgi:N-carbamoyl-L-amino-acid hydrolase